MLLLFSINIFYCSCIPDISMSGTKGVICYVLIYLFFEQDENKTQQIEEQNLTKVISEKFSIIKFLHCFLMY